MSQLTINLSRLMGIYLIVVSLALFNGRAPFASNQEFFHDHTALLTAGLVGLMVSLALIGVHNIWSGGVLPILVTLTGWILLIISVVLLFISPEGLVITLFAIQLRPFFHAYAAILFVVGIYMTYSGYRAQARATHNAVQAH